MIQTALSESEVRYSRTFRTRAVLYAGIRNWKGAWNSGKVSRLAIDIATPCTVRGIKLFVPVLFRGKGIPPAPPAFELPGFATVHHDVKQTRAYHNK
jgi:hypothetical protein